MEATTVRVIDCEALTLCELGVDRGWISNEVAAPVMQELRRNDSLHSKLGEWLVEHQLVNSSMLDQLRMAFLTETKTLSIFSTLPTEQGRPIQVIPSDSKLNSGPNQIGRYTLHEELGRGAMGVVYRATDTVLEAPAAIKVLPREVAENENSRHQLLKEARNAALLRDTTNFVAVYEAGVDGGIPFIAMELVDGVTLGKWIENEKGGANYIKNALRIAAEMAAGLCVAHERGLVHRDIKPANVMITNRRQTVKFLDFGVSKNILSPSENTEHSVAGTVLYMAPEVLEMCLGLTPHEESVAESPRVDIYGLGVTTAELFIHGNPFTGKTYGEILRKKRDSSILNSICESATLTAAVGVPLRMSLSIDPALRLDAEALVELWANVDAVQNSSPDTRKELNPGMTSNPQNPRPTESADTGFSARLIAAGGTSYKLSGEQTLGRSEDANITISHSTISRFHARFRVNGQRLTVEDLGSANGTCVNQQRAEGVAVLGDGDVVSFGSVNLGVVVTGVVDDSNATVVSFGDAATRVAPWSGSAAEVALSVSPGAVLDEDIGEYTQLFSGGECAAIVSSGLNLEGASALPHLIIIMKSGAQQVVELDSAEGEQEHIWQIGRDKSCEIAIPEESVSARHAQLILQNGRWRIVNLVAENGLFVNGKKRSKEYLSDGDEIKLGMAILTFKAGRDDEEIPLRSGFGDRVFSVVGRLFKRKSARKITGPYSDQDKFSNTNEKSKTDICIDVDELLGEATHAIAIDRQSSLPSTTYSYQEEYWIGNKVIRLCLGNIAEVSVEAWVSSDDSRLSMGGGTSAALGKAAGEQILDAVRWKLPAPAGTVVVTSAGMLPGKHILHAVTIDWPLKGEVQFPTLDVIENCAKNVFLEARSLKIRSLAVPPLGAGAAGLDQEAVAEILCRAMLGEVESLESPISEIVFTYLWEAEGFVEYFRSKIIDYGPREIRIRRPSISMTKTETDYAAQAAEASRRIREQAVSATKQAELDQAKELLITLAKLGLEDSVLWDENLTATITKAIVSIDAVISTQLAAIVHHEKFQKLEGSWRGLHHLISNSETSATLKIRMLNVSKKELTQELAKATKFDQSQLFKHVYQSEFCQGGGEPYGTLIGDYEFRNTPEDMATLGEISHIAAAGFCPFIASAAPQMFGLDSYMGLVKPRQLENIFQSPEYAKWRSFRDSEDARFVSLVLPRALARLPYGEANTPVEGFRFEELALDRIDGRNVEFERDKFCWMNASYVMGTVMTRAFTEHGWCTSIRGEEGGGKVENLPTYAFLREDGDTDFNCPVEIMIADRREHELSRQGFIPLCHYRNTDYAVFFTVQTTQNPKKYDRQDATGNAAISARLPYVMATSRIVHYLKMMARDNVGSFLEARGAENMLNRWVQNYCNINPGVGADFKARFPLAEARVEVVEAADAPGSYNVVAQLRPWLPMEELTTPLRLVASIPKSGE